MRLRKGEGRENFSNSITAFIHVHMSLVKMALQNLASVMPLSSFGSRQRVLDPKSWPTAQPVRLWVRTGKCLEGLAVRCPSVRCHRWALVKPCPWIPKPTLYLESFHACAWLEQPIFSSPLGFAACEYHLSRREATVAVPGQWFLILVCYSICEQIQVEKCLGQG